MLEELLKEKEDNQCTKCKDHFHNSVDLRTIDLYGVCTFCLIEKEKGHNRIEYFPPKRYPKKMKIEDFIQKVLQILPPEKRENEDSNVFARRMRTFNDTIKLVIKTIDD